MDNEEDTMDTTLANKSGAASTATSELHAPCVGGHVCGGRRGRRGRRRGTKDEGTKSVFLRAARLRLLKRLGATWRVETRAVSRQDPRLERAVGIFEREDNLVNSPNRGHCSNSHHPVCVTAARPTLACVNRRSVTGSFLHCGVMGSPALILASLALELDHQEAARSPTAMSTGSYFSRFPVALSSRIISKVKALIPALVAYEDTVVAVVKGTGPSLVHIGTAFGALALGALATISKRPMSMVLNILLI